MSELIEEGADVNIVNEDGWSGLDAAVMKDDEVMVGVLAV